MSFMTQDMPSFDHYAFNLRDGLRRAAVTTLSELEGSINDLGYGWLDGYMEQIMDRQNRAPITELMKTPSRTQTVKKTRATTAAAKERTDRVKGLNAYLALSPNTKQNSRAALSPLQPRSLNVSTLSPTTVVSPKGGASPIKSKPEKAKPKAKATKKAKSKKVAEIDENSPPTSVDNTSTSISTSEKSKSHSSASTTDDIVPKKSKSTRSRSKKEKEKAAEEEMAEQPTVHAMEVEAVPPVVEDELMPDVQVEREPEEGEPIEVEEEAPQTASFEPAAWAPSPESQNVKNGGSSAVPEKESSQLVEEGKEKDVEEAIDEENKEESTEVVNEERSEPQQDIQPEISASAIKDSISPQPHQEEPERKVDPTMPTSFANRTMATGTSQPVRQVRSSWLSKALGSNAVPINALPSSEANAALRRSYASAQRPSTTVDFAGLRTSLAPTNGLKRKSDHGVDEEEEEEKVEEERRPEKTAKYNADLPAPNYTDALPARTPGPTGRPIAPSKTPSFGSIGPVSQPNSLGRSVIQTDNARSDIHKVTRALDVLREKTAAKEMAKQRAVLAASQGTGTGRVQQAKSTGTGFLRGLGSIGAGLLGLGGSDPEEEAQRLARELEEERLAEMEFKRLMSEATKPDSPEPEKEEEKGMEIDEQPESRAQFVRSTTPEITSPRRKPQAPKSPEEEEEEMIEEQSVIEELILVDPRTSMATTQRQPSVPVEEEPQSTTPTGTPTRPASRYQARALHDREEKHAREPSIALQKEQQRNASIKKHETKAVKEKIDARKAREPSEHEDEEMEEEGELDDLSGEEEVIEVQKPHRAPVVEIKTHRKMPSSSSAAPTPLNMSTSSIVTSGSMLTQGQNMAAKALGVKPATGPVKSLQLAAAAAKKEQAAAERKATLKEAEARRQQAAKKKAEEDRIRADEERKAKIAEIEEKRRQRAELEKRQKERAEKTALAAKEKAEKEKADRDVQAAKLRAAEEEAARKRKLAAQTAALHKSQNKAASGSSSLQQSQKGKEPFRPTKQATLGSSASTMALNGKMGPSAFRTAETATQSSTITLVTQNQPTGNGERKPLGPPSRPSQHQPAQPMRTSTAVPSHANSILQQSRVALQTQLDEKAAMIQSEDIVLPDIASEYSDSDDEDRTKDFIPPTWAESPQLRAALEAQAHRNPDELFGPIKPLNMEELFRVKTNKFRARTSSANWSKTGDGLTKAEEIEYARRMGFTAMPSNLGGGSGSGQ
ncbi:hypothetical protein L486_05685 [Kwoniella mangroviensis CBS 10435]|uniref:Inner centromere protein ARK-binding domain-containing protein n=1 Tax=Kwoniella mangroviensis CBS 10435 TaxID=1331196 RepID=A0A1B9IN78_9TREE|nr:hypothetical protein L486_05685 [Kwoniella mangroviensis CBS 10435]